MKHKKHRLTDDDSVDSDDSDEGSEKSSSSDSDSDSVDYERRHKKKKRYESSSQSQSDSDSSDHRKRSKKRKHKKKKKKHSKKKRHVESAEESGSNVSYEHKRKFKHKHKHGSSKKSNSSTGSLYESDQNGYNVHSTVKESRTSIEDHKQPHATYYQKPYHNLDEGNRGEDVQRLYRGSSKDHYSQVRSETYHDHREHDSSRQRYEVPHEVDYTKPYHSSRGGYEPKEYSRGNGHHRQVDVAKRHDYSEGRKYQERRGGYQSERYHGREYPENRERYRDNPYPDRGREPRREKYERGPPPLAAHYREPSRSRSRSPRHRQDRPDRYHRTDDRRRPDDKRYEHRPERPAERKPDVRTDDRRRDRPDNDKKPPYKKRSRFGEGEGKEYEWGKTEVKKEGSPSADDKEKPNFGLSGKLTADANTVNGVVIKYTEPDDAKQPKRRWRFYPFKGDKSLPILFIHRQSCFILGRDKKVVDIHLEHPSVSKQHAALQYRATPFERADGTEGRRVRPYIIDLESANGTFVNNKKIEARRYVELLERDVVKFGFSQREYVLLHENSKDDAQDDDNQDQPAEIGAAVTTAQQIKLEKHYKEAAVADGD